MVGMGKVRHLIAKTGKTYCGRTITANGQGDDCKSCARIESTDSRAWESFGPDNVKAMAEAMPLLEQISETAGRAERAKVETVEPCFHCGRADSPRRDDIVIPFPHECVGRAGLEREGLLPPSIPTRPVTVAPVGTPCGWTAYGETGTRLTCHGGRDAVHILTKTLPVAVEGTALCGFHSPYDVTDAERAARKEQSGMDVLANLLSLDGGKTPARVIRVESGCRSLNHVYCVGPCAERDRNEANASAARTHVETEGECLARIKREDFRVGDAYTFRSMVGYRLYQDRPFTCRGLECQCGKACHGTVVESLEILTDVARYVSGGLEIQGHKGSRAVIRPDRLD